MLTKKKIIIASLSVVIIIGVAGLIVWQQFYRPEKAIVGPINILDDVGRNVTITRYPPERIVSLAPSCTEILFALGLGNKVVGVDELSDYPPEVQEKVKAGNLTTVGSFAEISIETVVGLQPDLVLATGGVQRLIAESLVDNGVAKNIEVMVHENLTLSDEIVHVCKLSDLLNTEHSDLSIIIIKKRRA